MKNSKTIELSKCNFNFMFSIVVPLYNKERFIKRCIDSVLAQDYSDYELIIVNDGSTDNSLSIVQSYDDERIRVINQTNLGVSEARNRGVMESSSEWIAFLDADDAWTENHLEELKLLVEEFKDAGIVSTKSTEIKVGQIPPVSCGQWQRQRIDYFRCTALKGGFINSSSVAIKRNVFEEIGYFKNLQQGEDTEFWCRVCLKYVCATSTKPTSFYYRGTGGIMETQWEKNIHKQNEINTVKDIGPAISLLIDTLETENISKELRKSVIIFINSCITRALKINLYNGRIDGMSIIGDFYIEPLSFKDWIWKNLSKQPHLLLMALYEMRSFVRNIYRVCN